jgi:hypothetical protein
MKQFTPLFVPPQGGRLNRIPPFREDRGGWLSNFDYEFSRTIQRN